MGYKPTSLGRKKIPSTFLNVCVKYVQMISVAIVSSNAPVAGREEAEEGSTSVCLLRS
jgi:hypothetical protein